MSGNKKEPIRLKRVRYEDIDKMTPYQRYRVILSIVQIIATLGVPFVVITLNEYLRSSS